MANGRLLVGRMDRIGVERVARSRGLPEVLARRVADVVVGTGLADDRRGEVFEELVAHFLDGLAAGRSPESLMSGFGEVAVAAGAIGRTKRAVTPVDSGGSGSGDGIGRRIWRDAVYAARRWRARPVFTAIAVVSLGVGIGANTAMFTLINEVILRKQALPHPEQLVDVYAATKDYPFNVLSMPDYFDMAREAGAFSGLAASKFTVAPFESDGRIDRLTVEMVSGNYFDVLGLEPRVGRLIRPADAAAPGQTPVVVLGERWWRRAFAGDPAVVGRTLRLRGTVYTVIGVVPGDYAGRLRGLATDLFVPITMVGQLEGGPSDQLTDRNTQGTFVRGRLRPGVSLARAKGEIDRVAADLTARRVGMWELGATPVLLPVKDVIVYPPIDRLLQPLGVMLLLVVALVLVVACANLASFLLARAVERRKEIAVRLAIGATRGRLIGQLLVETVLLALLGGALGLWLGRAALGAVLASDLPFPVPISLDLGIDGRVLGFSVAVSVAAGLIFGLLPALQSTRLDLAAVIRDEATGGGRSKWSLRNALVGGQVAVSLILMVVAGLLIRSLESLRRVAPGFGQRPGAVVWVGFQDAAADTDRAIPERLRQLVGSVPGVRRVGLGSNVHLNTLGSQSTRVTVDGVDLPAGEPFFQVDQAEVDSGFFRAAGLELVSGRLLRATDEDSLPRVAVVNAAFADQFWPGRDAVGRRFRASGGREIEVVGVVNTAKIRTLAEAPRPFVYLPAWTFSSNVWVVVETMPGKEPDQAALARAIGGDERLFVIQSRTLQAHIEVMSLPLRMGATALIGFAGLALLLACVGLYGAVAYSVAQRAREVGIRLSLGANRGAVVRLLSWGGVRVALIGSIVGLPVAAVTGRLFEGVLFGITGIDAITLVAAPTLVVLVAALAAYLPARRAGRLSPASVLRGD